MCVFLVILFFSATINQKQNFLNHCLPDQQAHLLKSLRKSARNNAPTGRFHCELPGRATQNVQGCQLITIHWHA